MHSFRRNLLNNEIDSLALNEHTLPVNPKAPSPMMLKHSPNN